MIYARKYIYIFEIFDGFALSCEMLDVRMCRATNFFVFFFVLLFYDRPSSVPLRQKLQIQYLLTTTVCAQWVTVILSLSCWAASRGDSWLPKRVQQNIFEPFVATYTTDKISTFYKCTCPLVAFEIWHQQNDSISNAFLNLKLTLLSWIRLSLCVLKFKRIELFVEFVHFYQLFHFFVFLSLSFSLRTHTHCVCVCVNDQHVSKNAEDHTRRTVPVKTHQNHFSSTTCSMLIIWRAGPQVNFWWSSLCTFPFSVSLSLSNSWFISFICGDDAIEFHKNWSLKMRCEVFFPKIKSIVSTFSIVLTLTECMYCVHIRPGSRTQVNVSTMTYN